LIDKTETYEVDVIAFNDDTFHILVDGPITSYIKNIEYKLGGFRFMFECGSKLAEFKDSRLVMFGKLRFELRFDEGCFAYHFDKWLPTPLSPKNTILMLLSIYNNY